MRQKAPLLIIIGGLFLFLDQFLKWQSLHDWKNTILIGKIFGWQPFLNSGVAFGMPAPNLLVLILTMPILILLFFLIMKRENLKKETGLVLIFMGALSNFIDRIIYQHTIDYFRIFTGVINLADVAIISGFMVFLFFLHKEKEEAVH